MSAALRPRKMRVMPVQSKEEEAPGGNSPVRSRSLQSDAPSPGSAGGSAPRTRPITAGGGRPSGTGGSWPDSAARRTSAGRSGPSSGGPWRWCRRWSGLPGGPAVSSLPWTTGRSVTSGQPSRSFTATSTPIPTLTGCGPWRPSLTCSSILCSSSPSHPGSMGCAFPWPPSCSSVPRDPARPGTRWEAAEGAHRDPGPAAAFPR